MSSLWYEYLEESGGEVISCKYFSHVCRSLTAINPIQSNHVQEEKDEIKYARNYRDDLWWPIQTDEYLSEGWMRVKFVGAEKCELNSVWWNVRTLDEEDYPQVRTLEWCVLHNVKWQPPEGCKGPDIETIIENVVGRKNSTSKGPYSRRICSFECIKVGGYLECWLEGSVGLVWPVKVISNIGGRVTLTWFGGETLGKHGAQVSFVLFYLDRRLRALGWAKDHGWKYCAPGNAGITVAINNPDAFVRGSPGALSRDLCNNIEPEDHSLEEGWIMEAVDPTNPGVVRPASIKEVFNGKYFLVELEGVDPVITFVGFSGLATLMPANLSGVSGFAVQGLKYGRWYSHLMETHPDSYAPHSSYFPSMDSFNNDHDPDDLDSIFLPGCKLEAVNPWQKDQIHAATVTRCMEGNRLVWIRLDNEPTSQDFLVDPRTSTDLFPVGWCEMMDHPLVFTQTLPHNILSSQEDDDADITIFFHPQCFLGPFLSRSAATQILPRFIGPGHCLPVFREFFHLLLKVSHKPHKLKRLLQLDHEDDRHDRMVTIAIPSPKSDFNNHINNRTSASSTKHVSREWLVEVAMSRKAVPEFCRQTALSLGACPWFITTQAHYHCSLGCEARLSAKVCEKINQQRRKRLFSKPLTAVGISYRTLKSRINGSINVSTSNSEGESSEVEDTGGPGLRNMPPEYTIQTRGIRLPVCTESRRRCGRRKPTITQIEKTNKNQTVDVSCSEEKIQEMEDQKRGMEPQPPGVESPDEDLIQEYAIDPTFLAGEIRRVTLTSNPLSWTAEQVAEYLSGTDCRQLSSWLASERVDGPAFLLLTLPVLSTLCGMQLEAAIRLCKHVVSLKRAFIEQFTDYKALLPPDL